MHDYAWIRHAIERAIAGFNNYKARAGRRDGFHLKIPLREREWMTGSVKP
ncbi:hypothetical protein [Massilia sp. METH4]